jgi:hypothetical protein
MHEQRGRAGEYCYVIVRKEDPYEQRERAGADC